MALLLRWDLCLLPSQDQSPPWCMGMAEICFLCMKCFGFGFFLFLSLLLPLSGLKRAQSLGPCKPQGQQPSPDQNIPAEWLGKCLFWQKHIPSVSVPSSSETDIPLAQGWGWAEGNHPWPGALVTPFCHPMGDRAAGAREGCASDAGVSCPAFITFHIAPHYRRHLAPELGNGRLKPARNKTAPRSF